MHRIRLLMSVWTLVAVSPLGSVALAQPSSSASWEESLSLQYRTGTVLDVLTTGLVGSTACKWRPTSTFKDGKMHAPGFVQNAVLNGSKCETHSITPGTSVSLSVMQVTAKSNRIDFVVLQCDVADCSSGSETAVASQVTFEFPKGFLAIAELAQVQKVIHRVFSVAGSPNAADPRGQVALGASQPASPEIPPTVTAGSLYVNSQNSADRLQLNMDNSFSLQEGGQSFTGSYSVASSTLKLHIVQLQKDVDIVVQGNELVVNGEEIWTQPGKVSSVPPAADPSPQLAGHYVYQKDARNFFNLKADGSMYLMQKGKSYGGRFSGSGDEFTFVIGGVTSKGRVAGDTITDSQGGVWVKQAELPPNPGGAPA